MGAWERLSMRARLGTTILALVTAIVLALSALHLQAVIRETFDDAGERGRMVGNQISAYLIESLNRRAATGLPAAWPDLVRADALLARLVQKSLNQSQNIVDVLVVDSANRVLVAADPGRAGATDRPTTEWVEWQRRNFLSRLFNVFRSNADLRIDSPIVLTGSAAPVLTVRVLLSPVLLRGSVEPQLEDLGSLMAGSLALSAVLAIIVSRLVSNSLERLGQKIDLIAQGDLKGVQEDRFDTPELVNIESKLWWLGRQYSGVRNDILQLRSNVEQMLRQLEEVVLVFGSNGRLDIAGEAAERLLARPRQEILGRSMDELFPPYTGPGSVLSRATGTRQRLRDELVSFERPNMPTARLLMTVEPVMYEGGTATGTFVSFRDAETRQQIRSDLDTARRLTALSHITSGVAHEIKNPLNAMMLHLEIAQDKMQRGADCSPELGIVRGELMRLDRVVKALLEFHRPVDVNLKDCELGDIADQVANLIRPQAQTKNIKVTVEGDRESVKVLADADLLKQGVLNVAMNGIEAMSDGGSLKLRLECGKRECVLSVMDEGAGIPAEFRDKIFNLYFTTKPAGTGVGLAMTYRIMQLHGGNITVDSERGKGTCVRLALPPLAQGAPA